MDLKRSKKLLREQRTKKFKSREAFANAYDAQFSSDGEASILRRYKDYEDTKKNTFLISKDAGNICSLLDIDLDYLLGRIDNTTHEDETICKVTGLNHDSILLLKTHQQITKLINFIAVSQYADEIERLLTEGLMQEAIQTKKTEAAYNDLTNPNDEAAARMKKALFYNFGASMVPAPDMRDYILTSLVVKIQRVVDSFFAEEGKDARFRFGLWQKGTASGAVNTESGQSQGR